MNGGYGRRSAPIQRFSGHGGYGGHVPGLKQEVGHGFVSAGGHGARGGIEGSP